MQDFKKELKDAYNADAKRRDSNEDNRDQWKLDLRNEFVKLLRNEGKHSILELGAGAGIDSKYFMDNGFSVLATDLSEEMVKMCRKRVIKAKVLDLYDIDTLDNKYDAVFGLNVLLHVPFKDLLIILSKIANQLHDNGIFYYGVYGGIDEEKTITDETKMNMPRFFSFLSDEKLLDVVKNDFDVIKFDTNNFNIRSKTPGFHFQSLFLRKR
jgi:cyclopropane fatty-acyl-phospholipid synthase-like methyltransferase